MYNKIQLKGEDIMPEEQVYQNGTEVFILKYVAGKKRQDLSFLMLFLIAVVNFLHLPRKKI